MKKVLLGMSGGVDSTVSALLLKEMGYEVTGVTMHLFDGGCCDLSSCLDAKILCKQNGMEHVTLQYMDEFRDTIIKDFIDEYNNNKHPKGLYLHGSFGSGKTYLIASLFNELAKKNIKSTLVYFPDFLVTLKSSFQTDYAEKFNYIKKTPLLLIDDIGAENCSNWSRDEVLGPILQYRMENNLPTFFTSNLTIDELEKSFSITQTGVDKIKAGRIIERIKYLTIQKELISKDRRIK